jgi:hypothetical protein
MSREAFGAVGSRGAVAYPFPGSRMNSLAGLHGHLVPFGLHDQGTAQHDRELVDSGRCPGSAQPEGLRMCAMLRPSCPVLARPTYSSMSLGGWPAAATRLGCVMSSGIAASIPQPG